VEELYAGKRHTICLCNPDRQLGDITLRVLETLQKVDFIAAEDTRHSGDSLIITDKNTLISYHEHNEKSRTTEVIHRLRAGENCA
jgi:16S rRNA (cytidine1402-2'-O)-methyltransferase